MFVVSGALLSNSLAEESNLALQWDEKQQALSRNFLNQTLDGYVIIIPRKESTADYIGVQQMLIRVCPECWGGDTPVVVGPVPVDAPKTFPDVVFVPYKK